MRHDRERGDDSELRALQERGGDQDAVEEVVDRVADHDQRARAAVVVRRASHLVLVVRVAPQQQLLEQEEYEDAAEDRPGDRMPLAVLEGLRDHFEKGSAEQRTDGVRHQRMDPRGAQEKRERRRTYGKHSAGDACSHDPCERHGGRDCTRLRAYASQTTAAMRPAARSRRQEKKRPGSEAVHSPPPKTRVTPLEARRWRATA